MTNHLKWFEIIVAKFSINLLIGQHSLIGLRLDLCLSHFFLFFPSFLFLSLSNQLISFFFLACLGNISNYKPDRDPHAGKSKLCTLILNMDEPHT